MKGEYTEKTIGVRTALHRRKSSVTATKKSDRRGGSYVEPLQLSSLYLMLYQVRDRVRIPLY